MITMTTDITKSMVALAKKLADTFNPQDIERVMAVAVLGDVHHRVHVQGLDSQGQQIGTYSSSYMKTRAKHKRGSSRKVILALTSQMEQDFTVGVTSEGRWALGWSNSLNGDKAKWLEEKYKKKIFQLTIQEQLAALRAAEAHLKKKLDAAVT